MAAAPTDSKGGVEDRHRRIRTTTSSEPEWRQGLITPSGDGTLRGKVRAERSWTSRTLHRVGEWTSHAWAGLVVAIAVAGWLGFGFVVRFPTWWQATLYSVSSAVTLI